MGSTMKKINKRKRKELDFKKEFNKFLLDLDKLKSDIPKYKKVYQNVVDSNNVPDAIKEFAAKLLKALDRLESELSIVDNKINQYRNKDDFTDNDKSEIITLIQEEKLIEASILNVHMDWTDAINSIINKVENKDKDNK